MTTTQTTTQTMTSSGTSYADLNAVLDRAGRSPTRSGTHPEVTEAQLRALQRRWTTRLTARLDQALEDAALGDEATAVARTWRTLAEEQSTLRAVLDAHEPELADALRAEYRVLALGAGLAGLDTPAADAERAGRELRDRIRSAGSAAPGTRLPTSPRRLTRRLVAALAHAC